ncbi:MAG TPA: hypothetical protein VL360_06260 [Gammaproteobacteria bacterium]|nr:hypothetical protein [Gammaproteobacteria bacterium]
MKNVILGILVSTVFMFAGNAAAQNAASSNDSLTPANPIAPDQPSESAEDINSFSYESTHDVKTAHPNAEYQTSSQPVPANQAAHDVLNRFNEVYRQKKMTYDQLQIDLSAAKDDITQCDKLPANEKTQCLSDANKHIDVINQSIADVTYDMNIIKKEIQDASSGH